MTKQKSTQLNCFSPPIMVATFAVEIVMAVYTLVRYKMTVVGRLIVASLCFLALFQLCEYFVCGGMGLRASEWSRLGFVVITTLPPLGLHLMYVLAGKPKRGLVTGAYATMALFIGYFLLYSRAFTGYACTGNYVIFQIGLRPAYLYGLYYYGWLLTALILGMRWSTGLMRQGKAKRANLQSVRALMVGYLVFLVPTAVANSVNPETRRGIPSIMCGFAVLFALILVFYILPRSGSLRKSA